jgi:DNA (cytosine-5)-methyltransferase 1
MSEFRFLSVCSGIEAASQAWHTLGWQCAGVSEIEKFPRAILEHRLGAVPVDYETHRWQPGSNMTPMFGDFTKIEEHHVGPIDLLVGGTPCQSFSVAGKRLGLDDPRGNLTLEFLALAKRVRPTWIVWENVPGILSHDGGRTFGTFLALMGECGFRWAYRVLDAQYARVGRFGRAVPQRRRRVFVVGYSGADDLDPRAVLFDRESLRGNPAPRREQGQRVAPTIAARTRGGGGLGTDFDGDTGLISQPVAPTLNAHFGEKQGLEDQHINGGGGMFVLQGGDVPQRGCDGPIGRGIRNAHSRKQVRVR